MALAQEQFERWLAGLPADLRDPTLYGAQLVKPVLRNATLELPSILGSVTLDSPNFTGVPTAPTPALGQNTTQISTTQHVTSSIAELAERFTSLLTAAGQFVTGTAAGTFLLGTQSAVLAVSTNVAQPAQTFFVDTAELPEIIGLQPKFRIRIQLCFNATAPTGNFTFGMYPITAVAGAGGGLTYSIGAVVPGSTALITTPAANSINTATSTEFIPPANGLYAIGVVTTSTVAASSHGHVCAQLRRLYVLD